MRRHSPPPQPTATPTLPPVNCNDCRHRHGQGGRNESASAVTLDGSHMCSITGNQERAPIGGMLALGATQTVLSNGNNALGDDARANW